MACHKTMKAGDILYVGAVRIRAANKTSLAIDADPKDIIIHATGQEAPTTTPTIKE